MAKMSWLPLMEGSRESDGQARNDDNDDAFGGFHSGVSEALLTEGLDLPVMESGW